MSLEPIVEITRNDYRAIYIKPVAAHKSGEAQKRWDLYVKPERSLRRQKVKERNNREQ